MMVTAQNRGFPAFVGHGHRVAGHPEREIQEGSDDARVEHQFYDDVVNKERESQADRGKPPARERQQRPGCVRADADRETGGDREKHQRCDRQLTLGLVAQDTGRGRCVAPDRRDIEDPDEHNDVIERLEARCFDSASCHRSSVNGGSRATRMTATRKPTCRQWKQ